MSLNPVCVFASCPSIRQQIQRGQKTNRYTAACVPFVAKRANNVSAWSFRNKARTRSHAVALPVGSERRIDFVEEMVLQSVAWKNRTHKGVGVVLLIRRVIITQHGVCVSAAKGQSLNGDPQSLREREHSALQYRLLCFRSTGSKKSYPVHSKYINIFWSCYKQSSIFIGGG